MPKMKSNTDFLDRVLKDRHPDFIRGVILSLKLDPKDEIILLNYYLKIYPNKDRLADAVITSPRNLFYMQNNCIKVADKRMERLIYVLLAKHIKFNPLS